MLPFLLLATLSSALTPTSRPSPAPEPDVVVSAAWLRTHASDPDLVILDVTMSGMDSPDPYEAGHIPGARNLDFHSIFTGDGANGKLTMELVSPDSLRSLLEALGVSNRSTIVLYSTSKWMSPVARTYVTLDYLGLGNHTRILNGGYDMWKAAGGAVELATPKINRGTLDVTPRTDAVTNGAYVLAHIADSKLTIVDARAPEFFSGATRGHSASRAGHVPGAHNVYYTTLTDSVGNTYLPPEQARAKFAAGGVPLDKPVIVYCHIGQTASVDYVQLRRLGVPVRLYDGSFEDWSRHDSYPVVTGGAH